METFTRDPNCLGYIVLYGASSGKLLPIDSVNKELLENNLADKFQKNPSPALAISRAANAILSSDDNKLVRTTINDTAKKNTIIFNEEKQVADQSILFKRETTGFYDKKSKSLITAGPDAKRFKSLFKTYSENLTGDDMRLLAREIVAELSSISLRGGQFVRDAGGVYFVSRDKIDILESLKNVLESLEVGYVKALCIVNGESERADIFHAAIDFYKKQIESYMDVVDKITSRISSLERILRKFEEIKGNVGAYAILTGRIKDKKIVEMDSDIQSCIQEIRIKIEKLKKEKEKKRKSKSKRKM